MALFGHFVVDHAGAVVTPPERRNDPALMAVAGPTAVAQFCFIAIAFAALTMCYVRSDFSVP